MKKFCDLHTHSVFSDGKNTPTWIVEEAQRIGLSAVALCDHNTVAGLTEFVNAAKGKSVETVCGVEISVDYRGKELHLLALYIPSESLEKYNAYLDKQRKYKDESNRATVKSLCQSGYMLDYDAIVASSKSAVVNRVHIANALIELGAISTVKEGFETLLSPSEGHYKPPCRLDVFETIKFIIDTNAAPVLAHPLLSLSRAEVRQFLDIAVPLGLLGIETDYSEYDAEETQFSLDIAKEYGLLCSGGSDYHGDNKPKIKLGIGCGNLAVPFDYAKKLKQALKT